MAREQIRLQFGKYNGDEHWGYDLEILGQDKHGLWLGGREGQPISRPGVTFAAHGDFVILVPEEQWWVATFNTAPGGRRRDIETYVDITTPTTVNQGEAFTLDLDLDVVKRTSGIVEMDDEDEFAQHSREMGYPKQVIDGARAAADHIKEQVESKAAPFDGAHEKWLAKVR